MAKAILTNSEKYLKNTSHVNNYNTFLLLMKDGYFGKHSEQDFCQILAICPKHEVQSIHFAGKQITSHCAIHTCHNTKHNRLFVELALGDIMREHQIQNEDHWIQSNNCSC